MTLCQDGSQTAYNTKYLQHYHSLNGAWQETMELYGNTIIQIYNTAQSNQQLRIADMGLGLGYNFLLCFFLAHNYNIPIQSIFSFEKDTMPLSQKIQYPKELRPYQKILQRLVSQHQTNELIHARLFLGDARKQLRKLPDQSIHFWLWDPFSPGSNPELWSQDIFYLVRQKSSPHAALITYSAANQIRSALVRSGWKTFVLSGIGKKKQSTLALHGTETNQRTYDEASVRSLPCQDQVPFRDPSLTDCPSKIAARRLLVRQRIRQILANQSIIHKI